MRKYMQIKKMAVAGALLAGTTGTLLAVPTGAASAYAGTPGCVTTAEYRSITNGMSQTQVARRFGTYARPYWGGVTFTYDSYWLKEIDREYRRCNAAGKPLSILYHGGVEVDFNRDRDFDTETLPSYYGVSQKYRSVY